MAQQIEMDLLAGHPQQRPDTDSDDGYVVFQPPGTVHSPSTGVQRIKMTMQLSVMAVFATLVIMGLTHHFSSSGGEKVCQPKDVLPSVINTTGCTLPTLCADTTDISPFLYSTRLRANMCATDPYSNTLRPEPLFETRGSYLIFHPVEIEHSDMEALPLNCCYTPINTMIDVHERGQAILSQKSRTNVTAICDVFDEKINKSVFVPSHISLLDVTCMRHEGTKSFQIYHDYFAIVRRNNTELQSRCEKENTCSQRQQFFNVIVLGVDSGSRLNFERSLTKTHMVLNNLLEATELRGYNTISNSSMSSFTSVTAGMTLEELRATCWREPNGCPDPTFLWEVFGEQGFATAFVEDKPAAEYLREDFGKFGTLRRSAVDSFGSPLITLAAKEFGHGDINGEKACTGNQPTASMVLKYGIDFMRAHMDHPYFGIMWLHSATSVEMNALRVLDQPLAAALREMHSEGMLDRTVVAVIAGRGSGDNNPGFDRTVQGQYEAKNPFAYIYLPMTFREKYPAAFEAVQNNAKRLVTPFDVHATLLSLADPVTNLAPSSVSPSDNAHHGSMDQQQGGKPVLQSDLFTSSGELESDVGQNGYGNNLFGAIRQTRSCSLAGIEPRFCMCAKRFPLLSPSEFYVIDMAMRIVEFLATLPGCAKLRLGEILHAEQLQNNQSYYFLQFQTLPEQVLVEATFMLKKLTRKTQLVQTFTIKFVNIIASPMADETFCTYSLLATKYSEAVLKGIIPWNPL